MTHKKAMCEEHGGMVYQCRCPAAAKNVVMVPCQRGCAEWDAPEVRLIWSCRTCGEGVDLPNKDMGRAVLGAWKSQHSGHIIVEGI